MLENITSIQIRRVAHDLNGASFEADFHSNQCYGNNNSSFVWWLWLNR